MLGKTNLNMLILMIIFPLLTIYNGDFSIGELLKEIKKSPPIGGANYRRKELKINSRLTAV